MMPANKSRLLAPTKHIQDKLKPKRSTYQCNECGTPTYGNMLYLVDFRGLAAEDTPFKPLLGTHDPTTKYYLTPSGFSLSFPQFIMHRLCKQYAKYTYGVDLELPPPITQLWQNASLVPSSKRNSLCGCLTRIARPNRDSYSVLWRREALQPVICGDWRSPGTTMGTIRS